MLVVGVPGRIARPLSDKDLAYMRWLTEHYVELAEKYVRDEISPQI
jgi:carbonic anhydrase/acetyltransferase-like protein (isoleucine patch superfamily)